jgi:hypothetical protein
MLKAQADMNVIEEFSEAASLKQRRDYTVSDFDGGKQTEELEVGIT